MLTYKSHYVTSHSFTILGRRGKKMKVQIKEHHNKNKQIGQSSSSVPESRGATCAFGLKIL